MISSDPQVRSILFNVFGGITRCDEVARGILAALDQTRARAADRRAPRRDERRRGSAHPRRGRPPEPPRRADDARRRAPGGGARGVSDDAWSERAELYRTSQRPRAGADLDLFVEWAAGLRAPRSTSRPAAATSRDACARPGLEVVSCDPAPGCSADVDLLRRGSCPSPTGASSLAVHARRRPPLRRRRRGVARDGARRLASAWSCVDNALRSATRSRKRERLRDPSHVRTYSEAEWRALLRAAGLETRRGSSASRSRSISSRGSSAPAARATSAARVRELLAERDRRRAGRTPTIAIFGAQGRLDGDPRRPRHPARSSRG